MSGTSSRLGAAWHRAGDKQAATDAFAEAISIYETIGAVPFAERCRTRRDRQVGAGETLENSSLQQLTERERRVSERVAQVWTNREIADELYVSPKAVECHLRNSFNKLGITGRRELRDMIQASVAAA